MLFKTSRQYREETSQKISWGHWFAFFNILWALVIGARYAFLIDWPDTLFGKLYFFISLIGHFSFIVFAFYLLIIFPLSFAIKNTRTFRGVTVIISTLCITILLVDTEVFSRFNLHLSSLVWNLLVNPDNGDLSRDWQIFFAPMPLILLVQMLFSRWSWYRLRSLGRQTWAKPVALFFVCMFTATHLLYAWADAYLYRPITMQQANFPLSYPMTARSFLEKHGFLDKAQYSQQLSEQGRPEAPLLDYPKHELHFAKAETQPNILFISISGLRHDAINAEQTPALERFAEQSSQYLNHYSNGNDDNAGVAGWFYGLNANYVDSLLYQRQPSPLIQHLQQLNYQFALFSAQQFRTPLLKQALFKGVKPVVRISNNSNQSAVENLQVFLQHSASNNHQPWFAYADFSLTQKLEKQSNLSAEQEQQQYQQSLNELDQALAPILQDLPANTLVILSSPHGYVFQQDEKARLNNFSADAIKVPMLIYGAGFDSQLDTKLSSHVDLLPTLLESLFKVENPSTDYAQGHNLLSDKNHDWVFSANHRWSVIITADGVQYHIDKHGNYQKYNADYQKESAGRPPLGLFLEAFSKDRSFIEN